ncbi:hypothetical protein [Phormidium tenue]|jgi:hypothetical protein|uniref:Uncharacterized protein n=1 Tax=Phormidium tenue FACHB-1050 TaxID=2692857 RepID=A0ABR8C5Z2_9CYAN|nr:hypothetical protein [Phormidium tenue]MBD2316074.1 hypothetical protein [Phormidium tenue FACHB-1050]
MLCPYEMMANCYDPKVACQKFSDNGVVMVKRLVTGNGSWKGALCRS